MEIVLTGRQTWAATAVGEHSSTFVRILFDSNFDLPFFSVEKEERLARQVARKTSGQGETHQSW